MCRVQHSGIPAGSLGAQTDGLAAALRGINPSASCAGSSTEVQQLADWMPWLNGLMTELQDAGCMKELEIMAGLMQHMGTFLPNKVAAGIGDWGRQAIAMTEPEVSRRLPWSEWKGWLHCCLVYVGMTHKQMCWAGSHADVAVWTA